VEQKKEQLKYETELLRLYWVTAVAIGRRWQAAQGEHGKGGGRSGSAGAPLNVTPPHLTTALQQEYRQKEAAR